MIELQDILESGDLTTCKANGGGIDHPFEITGNYPWTDLRIAASSTQVNGSNPPVDALFKDNGDEIPGTAYALSFMSTTQGNLNIPDNAIFDTSDDFTFGFWLRPQVGTQNNIECMRKNGAFDIDFAGVDQLKLDPSGLSSVTSSVAFNRGGWNWITVIHDTTEVEIRFYINNIQAGTISGVMSNSADDFQFNRQETLYDVDYIEYWDVVKTPAELSLRYAAGVGLQLAGIEVGLKGLWELNDGAGTVVVERTGISSNGSISGGSEGVQWAWVGGHVGNTSPGSRGVVLKYFSPDNLNELYFTAQMPHEWLEGSAIKPHIHWVPNGNGGVGERARWGLEYTWANPFELFGDTTIMYATGNSLDEDLIKDKQYVSLFGDINATGKTLSAMLVCRLFRDAENAGDTYPNFSGFLEFDFHYQLNTEGSRQEFIK